MNRLTPLCYLAVALTITPAFANDVRKWQFEIGTGIEREPAYTGSDVYSIEAELDLRATYRLSPQRHIWLSLGEVGLGWDIGEDWSFSAALEYEPGRENDADPILTGFDEIGDTIEGQFTVRRDLGDAYLGAVFQPDILGRGKGLVGFVAAGKVFRPVPKLHLDARADLSFADAEHMMTEIGVSSAVSARTSISAYSPSSGYKSTTLSLDAMYELNPRWSLESSLSYEYYGDEMAGSPLISEFGQRGNYEFGAGVKYRF